jgi:hypothetical protein
MFDLKRAVFFTSILLGSGLASAPAHAGSDPDVDRLNEAGHSLKWNYVPAGRSERYGHAEALVQAPLAALRSHISNFSQYKALVPDKFNNARIVGKQGDSTDVYLSVPVLHGAVTFWQILRFAPLQQVRPGEEVLEGRFVRGNVRDANVVFTIRQIDENVTLLKMDLLIVPNIPAPQSAIDEELRDAAMDAVNAIHNRAQGHARNVVYHAPPR